MKDKRETKRTEFQRPQKEPAGLVFKPLGLRDAPFTIFRAPGKPKHVMYQKFSVIQFLRSGTSAGSSTAFILRYLNIRIKPITCLTEDSTSPCSSDGDELEVPSGTCSSRIWTLYSLHTWYVMDNGQTTTLLKPSHLPTVIPLLTRPWCTKP